MIYRTHNLTGCLVVLPSVGANIYQESNFRFSPLMEIENRRRMRSSQKCV